MPSEVLGPVFLVHSGIGEMRWNLSSPASRISKFQVQSKKEGFRYINLWSPQAHACNTYKLADTQPQVCTPHTNETPNTQAYSLGME